MRGHTHPDGYDEQTGIGDDDASVRERSAATVADVECDAFVAAVAGDVGADAQRRAYEVAARTLRAAGWRPATEGESSAPSRDGDATRTPRTILDLHLSDPRDLSQPTRWTAHGDRRNNLPDLPATVWLTA